VDSRSRREASIDLCVNSNTPSKSPSRTGRQPGASIVATMASAPIRNASARACSRLDGPRRLMLSIVAFSEVEQQRQRGLRTYFVENLDVFGEARDVSYPKLSERDPSEPRPAGSLPGRSTGM
jgi:hypothetical protein